MTQAEIDQAFQTALQHHKAGELQQAGEAYTRLLEEQPNNARALDLFGLLYNQIGRPGRAMKLIQQAIEIDPTVADHHTHLATILSSRKRFGEAVLHYKKAIELEPERFGDRYELAKVLVELGQLDSAILSFEQAVRLKPDMGEAYYDLGMTLHRRGRLEEAAAALRKAAELRPDDARMHNDLGALLATRGDASGAEASFRRALAVTPDDPSLHGNLGKSLYLQTRNEESVQAYRRAIELQPDNADFHAGLGAALQGLRKHGEAIKAYERAIELRPEIGEYQNRLAISLQAIYRHPEAVQAYRKAIELDPGAADYYFNLAMLLKDRERIGGAIAALGRAVNLNPDVAEYYNQLATCLRAKRRFEESIASYTKAISLAPAVPEYHTNLANVLMALGRADAAFDEYRAAVDVSPQFVSGHSRMLLAMHYTPRFDADAIFRAHRQWAAQHTAAIVPSPVHTNDRDPDRTLRIGYVSGDFKDHSVNYFSEPLLASHSGNVEVVCYSNLSIGDQFTRRLRDHADVWRNIFQMPDELVAEQIRKDEIDILVDLSGHTAGHRLLAFAEKPAPVQVTYLGYPDTTGVRAIEYRITDSFADPPGMTERYHTEQLVRIDPCAWAYQPPAGSPDVGPPPVGVAGHITFGSFNDSPKLSPTVIELWSRILEAVPDSTLMLKNIVLVNRMARDAFHAMFAEHGIGRERVELLGWEPLVNKHLAQYNRVDVALDSYPYHGTTTTCEALWMGVPVVTLSGYTHVSRVGVSLLNAVGLPELVADSPEQYMRIATELAKDRSRLAQLRENLRATMNASPLLQHEKFARKLEAAYRTMWQTWCASAPAAGAAP